MPERKKKTAGRFGLVLPEMEAGLISCLDSFCRGSEDSQAGDILGVHVKGNTRLCLRQPEKKSSTYNCNRLCAHMGGEKKIAFAQLHGTSQRLGWACRAFHVAHYRVAAAFPTCACKIAQIKRCPGGLSSSESLHCGSP